MSSSVVRSLLSGLVLSMSVVACGGSEEMAVNPDTAPVASVDRFQDGFATLFKRSGPAFDPTNVSKVVPAPNAPINLDNFLVKSFGPAGEKVTYYSLDILPETPMKGFLFVDEKGATVKDQLPVIDLLPGETGYNDFILVSEIKVKSGFVANSLTSRAQVEAAVAAGSVTRTDTQRVVNFAVVPAGSTAALKYQGKTITGFRAWYQGKVAHYLEFETNLTVRGDGKVPTSPIIVIFKNGMSPSEGFAAEANGQTHNVVATLPGQPGYSSYWNHSVGKLSGFSSVTNLSTANANVEKTIPVIVNCPVVAP